MMKKLILYFLFICIICSPSVAQQNLPSIIFPHEYEAKRVSSNDKTGLNNDSAYDILPGQTFTIADIQGPAIITHLWFTLSFYQDKPFDDYLSKIRLKIFWDDNKKPAVDSYFGPFFGLGHNECVDISSALISVIADKFPTNNNPPGRAAFNCYFIMPFHKKAIITITNEGNAPVERLFYHVDYQKHTVLPENIYYFHASYRKEKTIQKMQPDGKNLTGNDNYVILDTQGGGHYIGCMLNVEAYKDDKGKWYEGDDWIIVDEKKQYTDMILGTGTEDYFNLAWGVRRQHQTPYCGAHYVRWNEGEPKHYCWGKFSLYRWHLESPIPFKKSIKVTMEHGHNNDAENIYSSVAYWYSDKP